MSVKSFPIAASGALVIAAMLASCAQQPQPSAAARHPRSAKVAIAPPLPVIAPVEYRPVSVAEAIEINAAPPLPERAGPAALPFALGPASTAALDCLTSAIYYEAASESDDGERAVAQVVLNRVRHPAFPASVCGVVYQGAERTTGCQFTFACDGALARTPSASGWQRARRIATAALKGYVFKPVGNATHYHANWVVPYWASSLDRAATIGAHIFYRWSGSWGTPRAFFQHYAGSEPDPAVALARWSGKTALPAPVVAEPVLLEDAKVMTGAVAKPPVLVADLESSGLVASLRKAPKLAADSQTSRLREPVRLPEYAKR